MQHDEILALSKYRSDKAKEELATSKLLYENGIYSKSLNCSYYSIFHATRALLAHDRFDSKKHSGVISFFIRKYIASKILDQELGKIILDAENFRHDADYMDFFIVSSEDAKAQIDRATLFIETIEKYILEHKNN